MICCVLSCAMSPQHQWAVNAGRCGVCGDPWDAERPEHEAGGRYANGVIGWVYREGDVAQVTVQITASHQGEERGGVGWGGRGGVGRGGAGQGRNVP